MGDTPVTAYNHLIIDPTATDDVPEVVAITTQRLPDEALPTLNHLTGSAATARKRKPGEEFWTSPGSVDSISTSSTTISTLSDISTTTPDVGSILPTDDARYTAPPPPAVIDMVTQPPTVGGYAVTKEIWWKTTMQIAIPFFLAGCGTIGAGYVLSVVQNWDVFVNIKALFILVPSLVGLKGNLDTCLASRLSTQANLGNLTKSNLHRTLAMFIGNIGLVQVQSIIASLLVAIFAVTVSYIMEDDIILKHALVVCSSAMTAATVSCFVLDIVLITVIVVSRVFHINPDNIAAPFAASIGDIVSLSILSVAATVIYTYYDEYNWIPWLIIGIYLFILLPLWILLVLKNQSVRPVLSTGWIPILSALLISGVGGIVLDSAVNIFNGFVVFQPIINGIGGNLVSIQSSRIATMLHQSAVLGTLPPQSPHRLVKPWKPLIKGLPHAATSRILLGIAVPGQIVFILVADWLHVGFISLSWEFILLYLVFALLQIIILLYMAHVLTHWMWRRKIDPDSAAVPFLTSTGDLLGTALLFIVFYILHAIGKDYESNIVP